MKRHNGRVDLYWVADPTAVKNGYTPKAVRLFGEWPSDEIKAQCSVLWAEMLEWVSGRETPERNRHERGTLSWLCLAFETDERSPYRDLRKSTQIFYSRYIKEIVKVAGNRHLADIDGGDVRGWHRDWMRLGQRGAYACIQTLRRVVGYGVEKRNTDAMELSQVLSRTEFTAPKGRTVRPTYEQIVAVRNMAHEMERHSIALAVTLQFDLGLRQRDVIGEWVNPALGLAGWEWGLTWDHIDAEWHLRKPTSKSNGNEVAEVNLRLYPDVMAELEAIPLDQRSGPVVLNENTDRPWSTSDFSRKFRKVARAAGWPDNVWNMDSRAGAVSEAFDAGAEPHDVMSAATHTQLSTTMGYNRQRVAQTSRVANARTFKRRNGSGTAQK